MQCGYGLVELLLTEAGQRQVAKHDRLGLRLITESLRRNLKEPLGPLGIFQEEVAGPGGSAVLSGRGRISRPICGSDPFEAGFILGKHLLTVRPLPEHGPRFGSVEHGKPNQDVAAAL